MVLKYLLMILQYLCKVNIRRGNGTDRKKNIFEERRGMVWEGVGKLRII